MKKLARRTALFIFGYTLGYHLGWLDRGDELA